MECSHFGDHSGPLSFVLLLTAEEPPLAGRLLIIAAESLNAMILVECLKFLMFLVILSIYFNYLYSFLHFNSNFKYCELP